MRGGRVSGRRWRLNAAVCVAVLACMLVSAAVARAATAPQPSFSAHGSVEQVYVTGLAPNAQMSLVNAAGKTVATQPADAQGGLVFRNVTPGSGYRVRPAAGARRRVR